MTRGTPKVYRGGATIEEKFKTFRQFTTRHSKTAIFGRKGILNDKIFRTGSSPYVENLTPACPYMPTARPSPEDS
jgi:hypothetical protein